MDSRVPFNRSFQAAWIALVFVTAALVGAAEANASTDARWTRPPNIVLILVDDLGWTDLRCYGSDLHETPNIDRLAATGMTFSSAYASAPVCSPTRASLMTGKYPASLRITDWIPGVRYPHAPLTTPDFTQELAHEEVTIAEALKAAGYVTLHVGKWHLGSDPYYPERQGFDVNIGGHSKGAPATYFHTYQSKPGAAVDWSVRNLPPGGRDGDYLTDRLGAEAVKLIEAHREDTFFLYLSFYTVHTPIEGKPELVEKYQAKKHDGLRHRNAQYAAMVQSLDDNVGHVLDALDRLALTDNTVVLLTSDNGGVIGVTDNAPLRAGKGFLYEGGIREPLIVRWPGVADPGSESDAVVSSIDFFPTIVDICDVEVPRTVIRDIDGLSFVPVLRDSTATLARETMYWHYPHYHTPQRPPTGAVRAGRYKLLEFYEDNRVELYDLITDVGERQNLAEAQPDKAAELRTLLHDWLRETNAQMPIENPEYDPERPFRGGYTAWGAKTSAGSVSPTP